MKTNVIFAFGVVFSLLAISWQCAHAQVAPLRAIEVAELTRTFDSVLVSDLDANPSIAVRAALAIGRIKAPEGAVPLRDHLGSGDPALRAMCAYALGILSDTESFKQIRELSHSDASSAVRYAAVDAIGRIAIAHPGAAELGVATDLLIVGRADADPIVRAHAVAQLDAFRAAPFAQTIEASLERIVQRDTDEGVRWHAMWAIARAFAPLADRAFLTKMLRDQNETVRLEAARAWGRRSDADAKTIVSSALADRSWRVQYEVREALKRLGKEPPTEHLTEIPKGLNLPQIAIPPMVNVPSPLPIPTGVSKLVAPDPGSLDLESFVAPTSAANLNGGRPGPHDRAIVRTTKGDITITLYREWAPSTVANFLELARRHYYDGNRWFRVVPDFVAQTGDPSDDGNGDAGYMIPAEENPIEQRSGVISMGLNYDKNMAERDSAGTQFYITMSPQLHLDRDFTVFGEVTGGFDVLAHLIESDRIISITEVRQT